MTTYEFRIVRLGIRQRRRKFKTLAAGHRWVAKVIAKDGSLSWELLIAAMVKG